MSTAFSVSKTVAAASDYEPLSSKVDHTRYGEDVEIRAYDMTDDMVRALSEAAGKVGNRSVARIADAILAAREGKFDSSIPNLHAAPEMFLAYFRANLQDGWVYKRGADGHLHAWLVTDVQIRESRGSDAPPYLAIDLTANGSTGRGRGGALGLATTTVHLERAEVTRKKISDILTNEGIYVETPELRADYDVALEKYSETLRTGFSEQFRFKGTAFSTDDYRAENERHTKVIHDLARGQFKAPAEMTDSVLFVPISEDGKSSKRRKKGAPEGEGLGPVPVHFLVRVFDLAVHDFLWVNSRDLERYVYDKTLAEKIVLPEDQRNLLDILTTDLDDFTSDIIEGKSIGNVVLCKGKPGVGKTLTAEVYAELIERPLYSIHSGNLGVEADAIRKNLETVFQRAKRWNVVLLLDEADVFVLERGDNIEQNAIVAEFLRTLEYFDGLMFMTTNRGQGIDDAILSRAAAIIDYGIPSIEAIREIWKVQMANQGYKADKATLDMVVGGFAEITGRDVKMLLRLCLRVANKRNGGKINEEIVTSCATFRGLHFKPGSRVA